MRTSLERSTAVLFGSLVVLVALASCSSERSTEAPTDQAPSDQVSGDLLSDNRALMCHRTGSTGQLVEGTPSVMALHQGHGDYLTNLIVTHDADRFNDGRHFRRIGDALAAARAGRLARGESQSAACRITISVRPGVFRGTENAATDPDVDHYPILVDVPDITLRGALRMRVDGRGRATGKGIGGFQTVLSPLEPLLYGAMIAANGHPDGSSAGNGLIVQGFVLQSGHIGVDEDYSGQGMTSMRVTGLAILGNRFEGGFSESIDLRATSAVVDRNHLDGPGGSCDICLAGPGSYRATSNTVLKGGIPGIVAVPAVSVGTTEGIEPYDLPTEALVVAEVANNEVRDHLAIPTGVGIRLDAIGIGAPDVHGTIRARIHDNLLVNNRFGMIFHAGFPEPETQLRGDVDATLGGNEIQQSCETKLLVVFARHAVAWKGGGPYILNSTWRLALRGDVRWNDVWYSHPEGYGNELVVDGRTIPNGSRQAYEGEGCPGLTP